MEKGSTLQSIGKYHEAIHEFDQVISDQHKVMPLDLGNAYMRKGNCQIQLGMLNPALENILKSDSIFSRLGNQERLSAAWINRGFLHYKQRNFENASICYSQALEITLTKQEQNLQSQKRAVHIFNELGIIYKERGLLDKAINAHQSILKNYKAVIDDRTICQQYINLANCYDKNNSDRALLLYNVAEKYAVKLQDTSMLIKILVNIGDVKKESGEFQEALMAFSEAYKLNALSPDSSALSSIFHNRADIYDSLGDFKKAYIEIRSEREIDAKLYNSEITQAIIEKGTIYETAQKDEQLKNGETIRKEQAKQLTYSIVFLLVTILLAIALFVLYKLKENANRKLNNQNRRIEELNHELKISNDTKLKLFSILSHDLRAPISSLYSYHQLQSVSKIHGIPGVESGKVLEETENLLNTLEDLLIWSKSQLNSFTIRTEVVNIKEISQNILRGFQTDYEKKLLSIKLDIRHAESVRTDFNMLHLILRNLISNAIKYATLQSRIEISSELESSLLKIVIKNCSSEIHLDNIRQSHLRGLNSSSNGLGFVLIEEFTAKLNGEIKYTTVENEVLAELCFRHSEA